MSVLCWPFNRLEVPCLSLQDSWDAIELSHDSELEKELRGWIPKDPKNTRRKKKKKLKPKSAECFPFWGKKLLQSPRRNFKQRSFVLIPPVYFIVSRFLSQGRCDGADGAWRENGSG